MGDFTTGGYLDIGIMTALYQREKTGRGDYVSMVSKKRIATLYGCKSYFRQFWEFYKAYLDVYKRQTPYGAIWTSECRTAAIRLAGPARRPFPV